MVADGMSTGEILKAYPDLEPDDIREAPWDLPLKPFESENSRPLDR